MILPKEELLLDFRPCSSVVEQYPEKVCVVGEDLTKAHFKFKLKISMKKKIGIFWIREDFRILKIMSCGCNKKSRSGGGYLYF